MEEDDIAIIGVGCKFPGAENLDEFWQVLINAENHVIDIPKDRWNNEAVFDEDLKTPGKLYVKKAGLLKRHDEWDNRLFGISDNETSRIDPQQRYVLECVHMAMEDGGITRERLKGSNTGVYIGCMNDDFKVLSNDPKTEMTSYSATGMSTTIIAARVSYVFDLQGPCLVLDTACSSSLVAIHLGCQAIRSGDCDMAICGGVSSILNPNTFFALCKNKMMSPTGQCQTFCDTADGYARGEGCGVVILQRAKSAVNDGNTIWATIETGTNQDGRTMQPITAPSGEQQRQLLESIYSKSRINPGHVEYIEAHGTGTPIGDPTEVNALGMFFSKYRADRHYDAPLLVGSVKSNIGHTESAAGIAGLVKVLLMIKHGKIVPSLHVKKNKSNVNKKILFERYGLDIALDVSDWKQNEAGGRIACLNSFGFGGSNCHAIINGCNNQINLPKSTDDWQIACISALDAQSLKINLETFYRDLQAATLDIEDVCYTSCCHRDHFTNRVGLIGRKKEEFLQQIKTKITKVKPKKGKNNINIVFVYCGVGTTWPGMCMEMMSKVDKFRETVESIDTYLSPLTGWKMRDKFMANTNYEDPFLNHIAIFAVQVALTNVWKHWGVQPDVVVGQSVGEVAAAYASGHLSLEDSVNVIYQRSKILAEQTGGAMLVVMNLEVSKVEALCKAYQQTVSVAVYSSPTACTISGNAEDIDSIENDLEKRKSEQDKSQTIKNRPLFIKRLNVQCAYHSPQVENCRSEIVKQIRNLSTGSGHTTRHISTVTGDVATQSLFKAGTYWADNVRKPVLFMQGIQKAIQRNSQNIIIEIGPRPVLRAHIGNILDEETERLCLPSLNVNKELQSVYSTVSELYETEIPIIWKNIYTNIQKVTPIPKYAFNKSKSLYLADRVNLYLAGTVDSSADSHMFVRRFTENKGNPGFQLLIGASSTPFVYDHFLSGNILVPGATYVEMGFHIGQECIQKPVYDLMVSIEFENPFMPSIGNEYALAVSTTEMEETSFLFETKSSTRTLSTGKVSLRNIPERPEMDIDELRERCKIIKDKKESYACLEKLEFQYGTSLNLIERSWTAHSECLVEICVPDSVAEEFVKTHFHPAIIDALFQTFGIFAVSNSSLAMPKGAGSIVINRPPQTRMFGYARRISKSETGDEYNALLLSPTGSVIVEVNNFHTRTLGRSADIKSKAYEYDWINVNVDTTDLVTNGTKLLALSLQKKNMWIEKLQNISEVDMLHEVDGNVLTSVFLEKYEAILFCVGKSTVDHDDEVMLFDAAVERFINLKKLLQILATNKVSLPLYVVTECTQYISEKDSKSLNLSGSELWGMVRSAMHEGIYADIRLVDINPRGLNYKLLRCILTGGLRDQAELCVSRSSVFGAKLNVNQRSRPMYRTLKMNLDYNAHLKSECAYKVLQAFFQLAKGESSETKEHHKLKLPLHTVMLKSIVKHHDSVYPPTTDVGQYTDIWSEKSNRFGSQIIAIEGTGTIIDKTSNKGNDICFCCPVDAASLVSIPEECIFSGNSKAYKPGSLILGNILYHMIKEVPDKAHVIVLDTLCKENDFRHIFMKKVFQKKACKMIYITSTDLENDNLTHVCTDVTAALILTSAKQVHIQTLIQRNPGLKRIVSLKTLIPDALQACINHKFGHVFMRILVTCHLFNLSVLESSIPIVRTLIENIDTQDSQEKMEKCLRNRFNFELPMEQIDIETDIANDSIPLRVEQSSLFQKEACYVLVGGLHGLGWELLQLIASMGAGYIVTLSRSVPTSSKQTDIRNVMQKYNIVVTAVQVDVTNSQSLDQGLKEIKRMLKGVPVKGIFHGAGVLADSFLINQSEENIRKVMLPKIKGAWNLHTRSKQFQLDYFVLHSSIVSIIGNVGQCNYAAGNSFMDTLAFYRRSKGLPAQTINWGALSVGMAVMDVNVEAKLKQKGFSHLSAAEIRSFFIQSLLTNDTQTVYANIDWDIVTSNMNLAAQISKYDTLIQVKFRKTNASEVNKNTLGNSDFTGKDITEVKERLTDYVKTTICEVFVATKDSLEDSTSLVSLGIDSMAAMSFSNTIDDALQCKIPFMTLMSDQTTISTIVHILAGKVTHGEKSLVQESTENNSFLSREITFMQQSVMDKYLKRKDDPTLIRIVDIEMKSILQTEDWIKILEHVMNMNPELRKRYTTDSVTTDVKVVLLNPAETHIDLQEVPFESIVVDRNLKVVFHLEREWPVKFQIAYHKNRTRLRIILHAIATDMMSTSIIFKDLQLTILAYHNKTDMPPKRFEIDIPALVKHTLQPQLSSLRLFWKEYMEGTIYPVSLRNKLDDIQENFCITFNEEMPEELVTRMVRYTRANGISVFHFLASVYQLFLHLETNRETVPIMTSVDMRMHIHKLHGTVARCVNAVPLVARFKNKMSLARFLQENSDTILEAIQHSAYPFKLIQDEIKDNSLKNNLGRHWIAINDMQSLNDLITQSQDYEVELKDVWTSRMKYETFLFIQHDVTSKRISFEFGFNSKICKPKQGYGIPKQIMKLIDKCMQETSKQIVDLRNELHAPHNTRHPNEIGDKRHPISLQQISTINRQNEANSSRHNVMQETDDSNTEHEDVVLHNSVLEENTTFTVIKQGHFLKQTTQGWDHRVHVRLIQNDNKHLVMQWGKTSDGQKRILHMCHVRRIETRLLNSLYAILMKTDKRWIILKTPERQNMDDWVTAIQSTGLFT